MDVEVTAMAHDGVCARAVLTALALLLVPACAAPTRSAGPPAPARPSTAPRALGPAHLSPPPTAPGAPPAPGAALAGAPLAPPARRAVRRPPYPVEIVLEAVTPSVPGAAGVKGAGAEGAAGGADEGDVTVSGTLVNRSGKEITGARVGVRIGPAGPLGTRSELAAVAARGALSAADGKEIAEPVDPVARLGPHARAGFRLRVPVDALGLDTPGAYPLTVALTGRKDAVRGLARTFLPWYPSDAASAEPLRTTVLWPLTEVPHMQALTLGAGEGAQPVFRDDALADSFAPGGRLRDLVRAGAGRPVTWVVDPDLIVQAEAMAEGYRVARTPDTTDPRNSTAGRGGGDAADWLAELKDAVRGREVVALPYADPDLASLAHRGRAELARQARQSRQGSEVRQTPRLPRPAWARQLRWGRTVVDEALGTQARQDLAWPEDGALDASITALAGQLGLRSLLASGQGLIGEPGATGATEDAPVALNAGPGPGSGPGPGGGSGGGSGGGRGGGSGAGSGGERSAGSGPWPVGGSGPGPRARPGGASGGGADATLTALTYDTTLTQALAEGVGKAVVPGRQRLLAETLTVVREAPNARRALVVVPPRRMTATAARALGGALTDGARAGWLEPVRLSAALRGPVPGTVVPVAGYPSALRHTELSSRRLAAVARDERRLRSLARVLDEAERTTASVRAALARAVSTAWRGRPAGSRAYIGGLTGFLTGSMASVRLVPKSTVTVAGDSATIPVTVENALQQSVSGVQVRVTSSSPERLSVVDGSVAARVSRAASRTVRVEVRAHANGPVRLTAQLYTAADGKPWGEPTTFVADVRSVSSGAVAIVLGGVALIVLVVVVQVGRARRRRARRAA